MTIKISMEWMERVWNGWKGYGKRFEVVSKRAKGVWRD